MGRPQLLVSVRNAQEAALAAAGGAHILDVKEPTAGSLGMAPLPTIRDIARLLCNAHPSPPLSLALGELRDWYSPTDHSATSRNALAELLHETPAVRYLKCGLSGCRSTDHWQQRWNELRHLASPATAWVAVAYADALRADAPDPLLVLEAAANAQAHVLLIDTFIKDHTRLLDWLSPAALQQISAECRARGLKLALAGRVVAGDFPLLRSLGADVIAVRGAACEREDRLQTVSCSRVRDLVLKLEEAA